MLLKDLESKILKKYNLSTSCINRPVHFRIPEIYLTNLLNQKPYLLSNSKQKILSSSKNTFSFRNNDTIKRERITAFQKKKLQKEKLDLLINKTYDKINNKIRMRNSFFPTNKETKIGYLSKYSKDKIKDDLIEKSYLMYPNLKTIEKSNLNKQYEWSNNFLEQLKMQEYKKLYSLKYIKFYYSNNNVNRLKNKNNKNEISMPNIPKINLLESHNNIKKKKIDKVVVPINGFKRNISNVDNNTFSNTTEKFYPIKSIQNKKNGNY